MVWLDLCCHCSVSYVRTYFGLVVAAVLFLVAVGSCWESPTYAFDTPWYICCSSSSSTNYLTVCVPPVCFDLRTVLWFAIQTLSRAVWQGWTFGFSLLSSTCVRRLRTCVFTWVAVGCPFARVVSVVLAAATAPFNFLARVGWAIFRSTFCFF